MTTHCLPSCRIDQDQRTWHHAPECSFAGAHVITVGPVVEKEGAPPGTILIDGQPYADLDDKPRGLVEFFEGQYDDGYRDAMNDLKLLLTRKLEGHFPTNSANAQRLRDIRAFVADYFGPDEN